MVSTQVVQQRDHSLAMNGSLDGFVSIIKVMLGEPELIKEK